ncbi:DUF4350 domain-containing protein [Kordiimonas sp. SCSIO 12610]|uniref:DUF4350 domain-containing protein n=1 Tax=Kordiimonas sp. SCSIO 12610 TaxID=2829597 RepID=UPI00210EB4A7|nr:hypothetical protein [Kordiimonas sp. SCSIO 12610]UTW56330.1 hypothetical protein KFF44_05350 [Kordiimonas sp. SCSIO 12610]
MAAPDSQLFKSKTLFWLIALGLAATIGMAVTSVLLDDAKYSVTSGTNSFSKSAIGHGAIADLLEKNGFEILKSQANTDSKLLGSKTSLFLLEPQAIKSIEDHINTLTYYSPTLLVLPKRRGVPNPGKPGWILTSNLLNLKTPEKIANYVTSETEIIRPDENIANWQNTYDLPGAPKINDIQLIKNDKLDPVIWNEHGILLGKYTAEDKDYGDWPIWILSDPDLLQNHGLGDGWNLDFTLQMVSDVTASADTIVIDEIIHGFTMDPSLARAMFSQPFIYATIASLLAVLVFMFATTRRFGAALRQEKSIRDSKAIFLNNTARIFRLAEREREALIKLIDDGGLQVAETLRAPDNIGQASLIDWLDARSHARGCSLSYSTIRIRAQNVPVDDPDQRGRIVIIAQQFHEWRHTILSGSVTNSEPASEEEKK